jgi:hypothetical protein
MCIIHHGGCRIKYDGEEYLMDNRTAVYYCPVDATTWQWSIFSNYTLAPNQKETPAYPSSQGTVGIRQAWRQPIRRKRPWLFWKVAEGWLRQRVSDGRDNLCSEIVFMTILSS